MQHNTPPPTDIASNEAAQHTIGEGSTVGRRGMHAAAGAFWNEEKDGMVRIAGIQLASLCPEIEHRDMSRECVLYRHVSDSQQTHLNG